MTNDELEAEVKANNLTAPRITKDYILSKIKDEYYHIFSDTQLTVCCLLLENGFTVTGESACASPENFNIDIGRKLAKDEAVNKIWRLEGYLLKQTLHVAKLLDIPFKPLAD